ncbi:hypothetical protein GQ42DRAFT_163063 [Ramicandelaber brevisporus]|nr:hypothetical protein GQ42DRAFT_163063 [Ramicandelaber brevisporus]
MSRQLRVAIAAVVTVAALWLTFIFGNIHYSGASNPEGASPIGFSIVDYIKSSIGGSGGRWYDTGRVDTMEDDDDEDGKRSSSLDSSEQSLHLDSDDDDDIKHSALGKAHAGDAAIGRHRSQKTDDSSQSSQCESPHPGRPSLQYVLIVDAGSTGSRIHVYRFNNCKASPELEGEVFDHTAPGLSAYPRDPEAAARSLDGLMRTALENVPKHLHKHTPVTVKATAGLRLLGAEASDKILAATRRLLETKYPFPVIAKDGVSIMSGIDEGVYAWITVNHLLQRIGHPDGKRRPTAALFDMGGGSTQAVFEPARSDEDSAESVIASDDHKYDITFGGKQYGLYQHSYLGYGLKEARRRMKEHIADSHTATSTSSDSAVTKIEHACFPPNWHNTFTHDENQLTFTGTASDVEHDNMTKCYDVARAILNKDAACHAAPCSFDGIHQPAIHEHLPPTYPIYIFSYFYDRIAALGLPSRFTLSQLRSTAEKVCSHSSAHDHFADTYPTSSSGLEQSAAHAIKAHPHYCMDVTFMYALLRDGYDIPDDRTIRMVKKINGYETGWCLGAAIAIVDDINSNTP